MIKPGLPPAVLLTGPGDANKMGADFKEFDFSLRYRVRPRSIDAL